MDRELSSAPLRKPEGRGNGQAGWQFSRDGCFLPARGGAGLEGLGCAASPRGDEWTFTQLADLNGDGRLDLLFGTHEGHIWLHRHQGGSEGRYDQTGEMLQLVNGQPLHVGPVAGQNLDFDVLQGARTAFTAGDFDGDGQVDLVVGDTYGRVRYFRNAGTRASPQFATPVELDDMKIRMVPFAADWEYVGARLP